MGCRKGGFEKGWDESFKLGRGSHLFPNATLDPLPQACSPHPYCYQLISLKPQSPFYLTSTPHLKTPSTHHLPISISILTMPTNANPSLPNLTHYPHTSSLSLSQTLLTQPLLHHKTLNLHAHPTLWPAGCSFIPPLPSTLPLSSTLTQKHPSQGTAPTHFSSSNPAYWPLIL